MRRSRPPFRRSVPDGDKEFREIAGATHYYLGQGDKLAEAVAICGGWTER